MKIDKNKEGGSITIDFFSPEDLEAIFDRLNNIATKTDEPAAEVTGGSTPLDDRAPVDIAKDNFTWPQVCLADLQRDAEVNYFAARRLVLRVPTPGEGGEVHRKDTARVPRISV